LPLFTKVAKSARCAGVEISYAELAEVPSPGIPAGGQVWADREKGRKQKSRRAEKQNAIAFIAVGFSQRMIENKFVNFFIMILVFG
jgi:hypothetical protein